MYIILPARAPVLVSARIRARMMIRSNVVLRRSIGPYSREMGKSRRFSGKRASKRAVHSPSYTTRMKHRERSPTSGTRNPGYDTIDRRSRSGISRAAKFPGLFCASRRRIQAVRSRPLYSRSPIPLAFSQRRKIPMTREI